MLPNELLKNLKADLDELSGLATDKPMPEIVEGLRDSLKEIYEASPGATQEQKETILSKINEAKSATSLMVGLERDKVERAMLLLEKIQGEFVQAISLKTKASLGHMVATAPPRTTPEPPISTAPPRTTPSPPNVAQERKSPPNKGRPEPQRFTFSSHDITKSQNTRDLLLDTSPMSDEDAKKLGVPTLKIHKGSHLTPEQKAALKREAAGAGKTPPTPASSPRNTEETRAEKKRTAAGAGQTPSAPPNTPTTPGRRR